jgi:ketosteroid isomerase-like protein
MNYYSKKIWPFIITLSLYACKQDTQGTAASGLSSKLDSASLSKERRHIADLLDSFNVAAAKADFTKYFDFYAEDAIFIGTDATENWNKQAFKVWAKPFFDKGQAWNFTSLERHIFFDQSGKVAWFDELLNTQMKLCRGSGVLTKQGDVWKVQQYVLSMTIPNSLVDTVVGLKAKIEDEMINALRKQ